MRIRHLPSLRAPPIISSSLGVRGAPSFSGHVIVGLGLRVHPNRRPPPPDVVATGGRDGSISSHCEVPFRTIRVGTSVEDVAFEISVGRYSEQHTFGMSTMPLIHLYGAALRRIYACWSV